jgi:hypothetical protein
MPKDSVLQNTADKIDANSIVNVVRRNSDGSPMLDQKWKANLGF